jgi:hypothetical protein
MIVVLSGFELEVTVQVCQNFPGRFWLQYKIIFELSFGAMDLLSQFGTQISNEQTTELIVNGSFPLL